MQKSLLYNWNIKPVFLRKPENEEIYTTIIMLDKYNSNGGGYGQ